MKYVLLIMLLVAVVWILRKARTARREDTMPTERAPERMVKCSRCGVNQPVSESILSKGRYFCCTDHRREAESSDS